MALDPPRGITIRIKRQKTTVFCTVEPTDTILAVKTKLSPRIGQKPCQQRLYYKGTLMKDTQKLSDVGVDSDSALLVAYMTEKDGIWEEPHVTLPQDVKCEGGRAYYE